MADKLKVEDKNQKNFVTKAAEFIVANKVALIAACAAIVLAVVLIVVISAASNSSKDKAMIRVDALEDRYDEFALKSTEDADYKDVASSLIEDLQKETGKKGYVGIKSTYLIAETYYTQTSYSDAYTYFMKAYELDKKSYLAPFALMNAAVCKEQDNKSSEALDLYKSASEYPEVRAKALFNVGRLYLSQGNESLAKATFQTLCDLPDTSEFKALATNILLTM